MDWVSKLEQLSASFQTCLCGNEKKNPESLSFKPQTPRRHISQWSTRNSWDVQYWHRSFVALSHFSKTIGLFLGYDLDADTFSPDGRLFQVEYATKAVDNGGTAIGLCCSDGVVIGIEKILASKMLVPGSNRRSFAIDVHVGMVCPSHISLQISLDLWTNFLRFKIFLGKIWCMF